MPFCRRCGEIVVATVHCKCGGTAVAPVVVWNDSVVNGNIQDKWSKTYVERQKPTSPARLQRAPSSPLQSFPGSPLTSLSPDPTIESTNSTRLPFPPDSTTTADIWEPDVLPSLDPNDTTLSKVYGSILQPPETIETHCCAVCSVPFPPDATLYPDPSLPSIPRYLCRPCFEVNGGSKGNCPTCSRPVLTLKSEGGFVHASNSYWHKRCFNCFACHKNIGDAPMIDLFGRPSCSLCFDNCLKNGAPFNRLKEAANRRSGPDTRQTSPAVVKELEQRLGIMKDKESHSVSDGQSQLKMPQVRKGQLSSYTNQLHPVEDSLTFPTTRQREFEAINSQLSPVYSKHEAVEEVKQRFLRRSSTSTSTTPSKDISDTPASSTRDASHGYANKADVRSCGFVPAMAGSREDFGSTNSLQKTSTTRSPVLKRTTSSSAQPSGVSSTNPPFPGFCSQCRQKIFVGGEGGQFITIPSDDTHLPSQIYHVNCFKCVVCQGLFEGSKSGKAAFVKVDDGPCHVDCAPAPAKKVTTRLSCNPGDFDANVPFPSPSTPVTPKSPFQSTTQSSSRLDRPANTISPVVTLSRRFGSTTFCPGCKITVFPMEHGVVPGPQGTRWHASCLVCGGKRRSTTSSASGVWRSRQDSDKGGVGCGKRLDSAARCIPDGSIWCRECLLLLGVRGPARERDSISSQAGSSDMRHVLPQLTGTTTLARQFTGLGRGGEPAVSLSTQLTGGLNPTRSVRPTLSLSMHSGSGGTPRQRAKSMFGIRRDLTGSF